MGEIAKILHGKKVYVDTNICIYLVEWFTPLQDILTEIWYLLSHRMFQAHSSELTLWETLIQPYKTNKNHLVRHFQSFLEESGAFTLSPTLRTTYILAAELCAKTSLKMPDAIHIATALETECDIFFTNDKRIKIPEKIPLKVVYLDNFLTKKK